MHFVFDKSFNDRSWVFEIAEAGLGMFISLFFVSFVVRE